MSDAGSVKRRRKPRQKRSEETVAAILEAAARVFSQEGYDATTNRIAEAAGVSIGSLYEYFENKDALLVELGRRHVREAEALFRLLLSEPDVPRLDVLLGRIIDAMIQLHERHPDMHETLERVAHQAPELAQRATTLFEQLVEKLNRALRSEVPPELRILRARMVVTALGALVHSLIVPTSEGTTRRLMRDEAYALCVGFLSRTEQEPTA